MQLEKKVPSISLSIKNHLDTKPACVRLKKGVKMGEIVFPAPLHCSCNFSLHDVVG